MSPTCDPSATGPALRAAVLAFLAAHARPGAWTYFAGAPPSGGKGGTGLCPDLVIETGGRVVYVEIRPPRCGPLPPSRRAWLAAARCRGAATATVRSVPDAERLLAGLGIAIKRPHRLADELSRSRTRRRRADEPDQEIPREQGDPAARRGPGAADAADRGPAAP